MIKEICDLYKPVITEVQSKKRCISFIEVLSILHQFDKELYSKYKFIRVKDVYGYILPEFEWDIKGGSYLVQDVTNDLILKTPGITLYKGKLSDVEIIEFDITNPDEEIIPITMEEFMSAIHCDIPVEIQKVIDDMPQSDKIAKDYIDDQDEMIEVAKNFPIGKLF